MVFSLLSRVVNAVKGGVAGSLKGVGDVSGSAFGLVKNSTNAVLKESGEFVGQGLDVPPSIVKGVFEAVTDVGGDASSAG